MKTFVISRWTVAAAHPTETHVTVEVKEQFGNSSLLSKSSFEFYVGKRFDEMSEEFKDMVQSKLLEAGIEATHEVSPLSRPQV